MDDAHPSELAGAASSGEKQNARRVAWVEHRSTNSLITNASLTMDNSSISLSEKFTNSHHQSNGYLLSAQY
jgi:hypothetical protein